MNENISILIGDLIRKERINKGLSLNDLSKISNISVSHLRNLENGNKKLQIDTLITILNALQINFFQFFNH